MSELRHFRSQIYQNPEVDLEGRIKKLRQANFKLEYKVRQADRASKGLPTTPKGGKRAPRKRTRSDSESEVEDQEQ